MNKKLKFPSLETMMQTELAGALSRSKRVVSDAVFKVLGIDLSYGEFQVKDDSPILKEIKALPEYKQAVEGVIEVVREGLTKTDLLTKGQRATLIRDVKRGVYEEVERYLREECRDELVKQVVAEVKKDPTLQPILVASEIVHLLKGTV